MPTKAVICWSVALLLLAPPRLRAEESLAAARQLYAAADYHNALAMLSTLLAANPSRPERQSIELYRIFCLFALNQENEANSAIEAMILRDPLYRPSMEVVPRRLRTAFSDARKRLLPTIIQEKYVVAKQAFDQGDFQVAATGFTQVLTALTDPEIAAEADQRPLSDLRLLANGFRELAVAGMAPPAKPAPESPAATPAPAASTPARAAHSIPEKIFQLGDPGVTAPVTLQQKMPAFSSKVAAARSGQLEIVIDETGAVESASIVASVDPRYNALVLGAAKSWKYRPATVDGVPVKFRKRIQLTITPDSTAPPRPEER
jgi:TonB family protein